MLKKFLFGRGVSKLQELVGKGVRHLLTFYGGTLFAADDVSVIAAAAVTLVGALASAARTFIDDRGNPR